MSNREPIVVRAKSAGLARKRTGAGWYNTGVAITRFLGADLAWREGTPARPASETGVAVLGPGGEVLDAGWTRGVVPTLAWAQAAAGPVAAGDGVLLLVDASLVVRNPAGQRRCETEAGQRYGRWKVSANTTNLGSPWQAGARLLAAATAAGWRYSDGRDGPPEHGRVLSETYPYTTLTGAAELGYGSERPRYKRRPRGWPSSRWQPERAAACDDLIRRLAGLATADPPLLLASHPVTRWLASEPSPLGDTAYKHREDLIDALLCAWTAALWVRHGLARCQVLGLEPGTGPDATIIAPARPEQRHR
jgi:predicted RNase H-like nuclease